MDDGRDDAVPLGAVRTSPRARMWLLGSVLTRQLTEASFEPHLESLFPTSVVGKLMRKESVYREGNLEQPITADRSTPTSFLRGSSHAGLGTTFSSRRISVDDIQENIGTRNRTNNPSEPVEIFFVILVVATLAVVVGVSGAYNSATVEVLLCQSLHCPHPRSRSRTIHVVALQPWPVRAHGHVGSAWECRNLHRPIHSENKLSGRKLLRLLWLCCTLDQTIFSSIRNRSNPCQISHCSFEMLKAVVRSLLLRVEGGGTPSSF
jgi:hypothetical protein